MVGKAPWITYRPELRGLDCTIRDGGLINNSKFTDEQVKAVYHACVGSGIDYMEIGYKNSTEQFPRSEYGPWRHCEEADLRRGVGEQKGAAGGVGARGGGGGGGEERLEAADHPGQGQRIIDDPRGVLRE